LVFLDGKFVPFPINIKTLEILFNRPFTVKKMRDWVEKQKIQIKLPKNDKMFYTGPIDYFLTINLAIYLIEVLNLYLKLLIKNGLNLQQ